jgi:hypothetical protein
MRTIDNIQDTALVNKYLLKLLLLNLILGIEVIYTTFITFFYLIYKFFNIMIFMIAIFLLKYAPSLHQ